MAKIKKQVKKKLCQKVFLLSYKYKYLNKIFLKK